MLGLKAPEEELGPLSVRPYLPEELPNCLHAKADMHYDSSRDGRFSIADILLRGRFVIVLG